MAVADKPLGDAVRNPFVGHVTRVSCVASRAVVPQDAFVRGEPQAVVGGSEQVVDDDFAFGPFPVVGQADAVDLLAFEVSLASPLSVPIQTMFCRSRKSVRSELLGSDVGSDSEL